MDIKSLSELLTGRPVVSQASDLLTQLKAAGTIEAEVIKLLQGKLLLSSRLGEILTTNTLNYKPGDQIKLRLGGSEQHPVLKVSPKNPRAVTLDSEQNPRLRRALPVSQAALAVVTRIAPQRIEIRLAGQTLTLPRHPGVVRDQLLSLQLNDAGRSIEITPVDRKLVYKALLKQLVPQQSKPGSTSLVRLLNLVNKAVDATATGTLPIVEKSQSGSVPDLSNFKNANSKPAIAQPKNAVETPINQSRIVVKPEVRLPLPVSGTGQKSATAKPENLQSPIEVEPAPTRNNRQVTALLRQIRRPDAKPAMPTNAARPKPTLPTAVTGVAQTKEIPIPLSTTSIGKDTVASTASSAAKIQPGPDAPINTRFTAESGSTVLNNQSRAGSSLPINHSGVIPAADTTPANTAPTILQTLLHRVSNLADTNAARVKQWFEFASLIRAAKTESTLAPSIEAIQTLKQLNDPESFMRELTQTIQFKLKSQAGDDAPTTKSLPQETLLQHARDGIKLVEQSLSQNLLQRASLGMQQETQQALSFSFALPFLDGQEVKPLHIDLAQREPAQQDSDQGWDIRLSFEFAGLGAISCHIFLEGMTVAVSFYSDQNQTRNRIELALPELKQQLSSAGFSSGEFHSFAGIKDQAKPSTTTRFSESLIDLEA